MSELSASETVIPSQATNVAECDVELALKASFQFRENGGERKGVWSSFLTSCT